MFKKLENKIVVVAMYHFVKIDDLKDIKLQLKELCDKNSLLGTILLASEGLNGTIAGHRAGVDILLSYFFSKPRFKSLRYKESYVDISPFRRMKVRLKKEIVSMGVPDTDPNELAGKRVNAMEWNKLLLDPEVITIDVRNIYEHEVGTFENSISPKTKSFRDFPNFVDTRLDPTKHQKIAMFCTGGIRCEKASNYMIKKGFKDVYHLDGGILKYLETVDKNESLWKGECFVFDNRVAVDKNLVPGSYIQCHACRRPLSVSDLKSTFYEVGVSCHNCIGKHGVKKIASLKERQRQYELTKRRKKIKDVGSFKNKKKPNML